MEFKEFARVIKNVDIEYLFIDIEKTEKELKLEEIIKKIKAGENCKKKFYKLILKLNKESQLLLERFTEICVFVDKVLNSPKGSTFPLDQVPKYKSAVIMIMCICKSKGIEINLSKYRQCMYIN